MNTSVYEFGKLEQMMKIRAPHHRTTRIRRAGEGGGEIKDHASRRQDDLVYQSLVADQRAGGDQDSHATVDSSKTSP